MFDSAQKKTKEIVDEIYNNSPRKTKYINGHPGTPILHFVRSSSGQVQ